MPQPLLYPLALLSLLLTLCGTSTALAAQYQIAVFPIFSEQRTRHSYAPMLEYLQKRTGHRFTLVTNKNMLTHWQAMKRHDYDFVLDGPHFVDYRIQKMGHEALVKFPSVVSYTIVANPDLFVLEPEELIAKTIATTPSPALGAINLNHIYSNPLRQPYILETADSLGSAEAVVEGKADAAIIPTPMAANFPNLTPVVTTEQLPSPGLTASSEVPQLVKEEVKKALLEATENKMGQKVLESLNIPNFEPASAELYKGAMDRLQGVWGY